MDAASRTDEMIFAGMSRMVEHLPVGSLARFGGVSALITGVAHPSFNTTWSPSPQATPDDLGAAIDRLANGGYPYSAEVRADTDDRFLEVLIAHGFTFIHTTPAMLTDRPSGLPWPDDLELVTGPEAQADHEALLVSAFGLDPHLVTALVKPGLFTDPRVSVVVGRADGVPATTALSVRVDDVVAVYNVATDSAFRGRGFGAAATAAVIDPGFRDGATAAVLQSSEMGFRVYESLGFTTVLTHHRWGFADEYAALSPE